MPSPRTARTGLDWRSRGESVATSALQAGWSDPGCSIVYNLGGIAQGEGAPVARFIEVGLEKRDRWWRARLLDDEAPRTCAAVWDALPLGGDLFHAKYA